MKRVGALEQMTPGAKLVGREVLEVDPEDGCVRLAFTARPEFANRHGTVSGGFLAAMLDSTTAAPILAFLPDELTIVTTDLRVSYVRPAPLGRLLGTGRVRERGERDVVSEGELADPEGNPVARATATFRIVEKRTAPGPASAPAGDAPLETKRITRELLPSATQLVAEAFFTNPVHVYLCPDPDRRFAQLSWMLGGNLSLPAHLARSFCLAHGPVVDAMGFFTKPHEPEVRITDKLRAGMFGAPLRLGLAGVRRLAEVTRAIDGQLSDAVGTRPVWYLNNMVVRKELRGTGVGSRLLLSELRARTAEQPGWDTALATQRPENVTFYRRLGFDVASERRIGRGKDAFQNWILVRPAG